MIFSTIYTDFSKNDDCPCGNGKKAHECCLGSNNQWDKKPSNIHPSGLISGIENEKCYAKSTKNCCSKISKEHYISETVLENFADGNSKVKISGMSWIPDGDFRYIPIQVLKSDILCLRHNNALSPLDNELGKFTSTLIAYEADFNNPSPIEEIKIFCGEDIERWMLKTICNQVNSDSIAKDGAPNIIKMGKEWVDVLYGAKDWPEGWGMYLEIPGESNTSSRKIGFRAYTDDENNLIAAAFYICSLTFFFCLGIPDFAENVCVYRPKTIIFQDNDVKKYMEISWQNKFHNDIIRLTKMH